MANTSISGLVSGLDTSTIISQLMQIEAQPQTILKTRVSTEQQVVTALQGLNAKLAGIATKAADLAALANWSPTKATSTNANVLVTADAGVSASSISFTVASVASSASAAYATTGTATTAGTASNVVMAAGVDYTITYDDGRAAETINTGDGTLAAIAKAINGTTGLAATLVRSGTAADGTTPTYQLSVASRSTGALSGFTIAEAAPVDPANPVPFMGGTTSTSAGADAELVMNGQSYRYSTNTITDLMPGVDVTLSAGATGAATITIAPDSGSLSDKVQAMVDAVNSALDDASRLTAYDATTQQGGLLGGDSTVRGVRDQLIESVTGGVGGQSLAPYGIQVDRSGRLVFDADKFKAAYAADPSGTAAKFAAPADPTATGAVPGFAATLQQLATSYSDSLSGTLTLSIQSHQTGIKGMQDDIADWDVRLAARQETLQRQYTALETALGKLQSQSSWLAGQIGSLPTSSGQ